MLSLLAWAFSNAAIGDASPVVHKLLVAVASLVAEHGLQGTHASVAGIPGDSRALEHMLSSCGAWA